MTDTSDRLETQPEVQIAILSCDRPEYCRQAVASALAQSYAKCRVLVSDNSSSEVVADMLERDFPALEVIRRRPTLPPLAHFNLLISEARSELLVLFHDDDVLEPEYAKIMAKQFVCNPEIAAAACNARILRGDKLSKWTFMDRVGARRVLHHASDLLEPYLTLGKMGPAPFPGYMYRSKAICGLSLEAENGGKHSDVSFLVDVLGRGPLVWIGDSLMRYRFHGKNDSSSENISHRLIFLRHLIRRGAVSRCSRAHMDFRFNYWLNWLRQERPRRWFAVFQWNNQGQREKIARSFVIRWGVRMAITRTDFWYRAFRVALR